jgi:hypothetical protein
LQTTATTYTVWANNSGGSSVAYLNITVNDEAPDISYNPDWFVLTNNTAMSPTATPTNSGGAIPSGIVDSGSNLGSYTSIALDSNGYKHISYYHETNKDLMYATDKSGSWVTTSIDTSGIVGHYTSIAIDSNDDVHISYYDVTNAELKYATDKSGSWVTTSIDTSGIVGTHTSIAIDSNDDVHISYYDATNTVLKYATDKSGSWVTTSIDTSGNVGYHTSIAIDSNDAVHISYYDNTNGDLKYATDKSGSWVITSIDTSGIVGINTSIALDSNDDVHISYHDYTNADLKYATDKSGSWVTTSIDTSLYVGYYSSIALDSNDDVHISHYDLYNGDLKYATDKSGSWVTTSIDTSGNVGAYTSIGIDSNDAVHISYRDTTDNELKYIGLDSSSNVLGYSVSPDLPAGLSLNIATGEISGTPTALSINTTYTITVRNSGGTNTTTVTIVVNDEIPSFYYSPDEFNFTKGVTILSNIIPINTGGTPTSYTISPNLFNTFHFNNNNGIIGGTPSIILARTQFMITATNSGGSSVTYINVTINDQLPTLSYSPENLTLTKGQSSTDLPLSATLTGSGTVTSWAISPALPSGLTFGTSNGTIWGTPTSLMALKTFTILANNSGGSSSATVNITVNDEAPDISYNPDWFVLTNNTAMSPTATSTNAGGAIPSGIIDSSAYVGRESSIAVDSNGFTHIAHYDATNSDLKYTTDKSGAWVSTTVDVTGIVGKYPSIALDSNGKVHISYFDQTNNDLKFATDSSGAWVISSIVTSDDVGKYSSIAIDSNDKVHISYYDESYGSFQVLTQPEMQAFTPRLI